MRLQHCFGINSRVWQVNTSLCFLLSITVLFWSLCWAKGSLVLVQLEVWCVQAFYSLCTYIKRWSSTQTLQWCFSSGGTSLLSCMQQNLFNWKKDRKRSKYNWKRIILMNECERRSSCPPSADCLYTTAVLTSLTFWCCWPVMEECCVLRKQTKQTKKTKKKMFISMCVYHNLKTVTPILIEVYLLDSKNSTEIKLNVADIHRAHFHLSSLVIFVLYELLAIL